MRSGAERLRAGLLAGAVLLALVVAGFLVWARWQAHRLLAKLPDRLGAEIQKETNGFTYSQSVGGRTVFTIHAVRATQRKDGQALLHDVGIVLYGKDGRADRIHGMEFDYDQAAGVVKALGAVQLDLQAPAPATARERAAFAAGGKAPQDRDGSEGQPVHVVTSGLVYLQKLGVASTEAPVQFSFRGAKGEAVGASFSSDTGRMTLEHSVQVMMQQDGRPAVLTASHAELDRPEHVLRLQEGRYVVRGGEPAGEQRSIAAEQMVVLLREDGSVREATGENGTVLQVGESEARAPRALLTMTEEGRPQRVRMMGGVSFARGQSGATAGWERGSAAEAEARLRVGGGLETLMLQGGAHLEESTAAGQRRLDAREAVLHFGAMPQGQRAVLERVEATGNARVQETQAAGERELDGEQLVATLGHNAAGKAVLQEVRGTGQTVVHRGSHDRDETSRGDRLQAQFGTGPARAGGRGRSEVEMLSAIQEGNVRLERTAAGKDGSPEVTRGRAQTLRYDSVAQSEVLEGGVEIAEPDGTLRAEKVTYDEATTRAEATGGVQATYLQANARAGESGAGKVGAGAPLHVASERAVLEQNSGRAQFFGRVGADARMWQAGSQVAAPVLVLDRDSGVLEAHGLRKSGDGRPVRSVFDLGAQPEGADAGKRPELLRVQSGTLRYVDESRQATFGEGVMLEIGESTIESRTAVATLKEGAEPGKGRPAKMASSMPQNGLERVLATDDVVLRQPPGRVATGQQALYTAETGEVVLTGTARQPPRVRDPQQGELTGTEIRFQTGDNSFTVDAQGSGAKGGAGTGATGRVHARVRVADKAASKP